MRSWLDVTSSLAPVARIEQDPMTNGRAIPEFLRVLTALQTSDKKLAGKPLAGGCQKDPLRRRLHGTAQAVAGGAAARIEDFAPLGPWCGA